jgi:DNA primase
MSGVTPEKLQKWLVESGARRIRLSPTGNFVSTCPFHEDNAPSFSIHGTTGLYHCFSQSCGAVGNAFTFVTRALGWTQAKAVEELGAWDGDDADKTVELLSKFPDYADRFKSRDDSVSETAISAHQLGAYNFCPRYLLNRGFDKAVLSAWEVGYDLTTGRVTIPVRAVDGLLVGISKRADEGTPGAKYVHLGFNKGSFLYGADQVSAGSEVWVGEGQLDAIALDQFGLPRGFAVSTMGALVSDAQIKLLSVYKRVVLCFDNDLNGVTATLRVGNGLVQTTVEEIFVADKFPDNVKDPADLLRATPQERHNFITQLTPYELWSVNTLLNLSEGTNNARLWRSTGSQEGDGRATRFVRREPRSRLHHQRR